MVCFAVLFQLQGPGLHGEVHNFEKPWFTTWESALSCWVSLVVFWIIQAASRMDRKSPTASSEAQPLLEHDPKVRPLYNLCTLTLLSSWVCEVAAMLNYFGTHANAAVLTTICHALHFSI